MALLGNDFSEYVRKQIVVRQNALGQGYTSGGKDREIPTQKTFNSSTAWMRLASAVKITEGDTSLPGMSVAEQIKNNGLLDGLSQSDWLGQGLAKNLILRGAPTNLKGKVVQGVNSNPSSGSDVFGKAYGWGYNANGINSGQGLVPPPGVTNVDFKYQNDGALAKATITIKAFSAEQFALIDILYMRPGYTCLLEFGHSMYLSNGKKIVNLDTSQTSPLSYLFQEGNNAVIAESPSYTKMAEKISNEKALHDGNYEGFFGKVAKWNWKFNADGSYDITVNLTGLGDIISSLKVNIPKISASPKSFKSKFKITPTNSNYSATSLLNSTIESINEVIPGTDFDIPLLNTEQENAAEEGSFIISNAQSSQLNFELYSLWADPNFPNTTTTVIPIANPLLPSTILTTIEIKKNINAKAYSPTFTNIPISSENTPREFKMDGGLAKFDITAAVDPMYSPIALIKFGGFLTMLQKICNITDGKSNFLLQFEMVEHISRPIEIPLPTPDNTFLATYPGNFSSDPNVCLIKFDDFEPYFKNPPTELNNLFNLYSGAKGVSHLQIGSLINSTITKNLADTNHLVDPKYAYPLSEVYINLNFIATVLENLKGSDAEANNDTDINVLDLLKGILNGVNTSLGGLNDFRVIFNENTSQIDIISETPLLSVKDPISNKKVKNQTSNYTTINTFGFETVDTINGGSFVTAFNLNSELTNQYATQISIGAQNNANTINGSGTSFSTYNKGLVDNLFALKQSTLEDKTTESTKSLTGPERISKIWEEGEVDKALEAVYNDNNFDEDKYINTLTQIQNSITPLMIGEYNNQSNCPSPTFLPFDMSLEMHGLGGLKIYEGFQINGKGLPLSYDPKQMKLIIKSLSHSVSLEGWKTKISTISKPIFTQKDLETPSSPQTQPSSNKGDYDRGRIKTLNIGGVDLTNGDIPDEYLTNLTNEFRNITTSVNNSDGQQVRMLNEAASKLQEMIAAAKKSNITLYINSVYRTYEDQVRVANHYKNNPGRAAYPGTSNHGFGRAIDFSSNQNGGKLSRSTNQFKWLKANAGRYGFTDIPSEAWHWEYLNINSLV